MNQHLNASELRWVVKYRAGLRPAEKRNQQMPRWSLKKRKKKMRVLLCDAWPWSAHSMFLLLLYFLLFHVVVVVAS